MPRMTPSEALVETLVAEGIRDVFGIVGSAFMDALDLFPAAGIRFIPVAHEQRQRTRRRPTPAYPQAAGLHARTSSAPTSIRQKPPHLVVAPRRQHTRNRQLGYRTGASRNSTRALVREIDQIPGTSQPSGAKAELARRASTWANPERSHAGLTSPATFSRGSRL